MKSVLKMLPVLLAVTAFTSCTNYGKKIKIDGTKGEVYYKGDGVTESDAKKLGEFLKTEGFFTNDKGASVQISKVGDRYLVRFVYEKSVYDKMPQAESLFKQFTKQISTGVFSGAKVDIALADDQMKDFKSIPYDETTAKVEEKTPDTNNTGVTGNENSGNTGTDAGTASALSDYDHDVAGGVTFYWKGITDTESKTIADYIVKNGAFYTTKGNVNIIMDKAGDKYTLKFPVADEYLNDQSILKELETVSKQIKDNVFTNASYSFIMTDTKLNNIHTWDY